jgi:tripartite-type tricarboxylate transporter receptor subunit TctC
LRLAAGAVAFPSLLRFASAFDYPTRPVHLIAGFPPGGVVDLMARMISQALSERLGQRFVVENRTGAGGSIATEYVARANPDGYTLLLTSAADAWNTAIYDNLNFDYLRDITPVASIERAGGVMEVNLSVPANSVTEFIAYAKANPGKINMASAGPGSGPHIYGELFKSMAGVDLVTVHYRGAGPAYPDLIGGRVQVMFDPVATSIEQTFRPLLGIIVGGQGCSSSWSITRETSPPQILASGSQCGRAASLASRRIGTRLPSTAGAHHRRLSRR